MSVCLCVLACESRVCALQYWSESIVDSAMLSMGSDVICVHPQLFGLVVYSHIS